MEELGVYGAAVELVLEVPLHGFEEEYDGFTGEGTT
jgi:hypothetical protein